MRYMIHASPARMWYVREFLIPSLEAQGILPHEIAVWNDDEGKGNLFSCMEAFRRCGETGKFGTWHLQDDVIISRRFRTMTEKTDLGVVCGFGCRNFGPDMEMHGELTAPWMWYSFQCIRIPDSLAGECAEWFFEDAMHRTKYAAQVVDRRHDDWFFREFMLEKHRELRIVNLKPNLVDHIDYLIGGTLINRLRRIRVNRAAFFPDGDLVEKLEAELKTR